MDRRANGFKYLNGVNIKGKTVLMRVDLNSNVVDYKVVVNDRIKKHGKVMADLSDRGAKVVVISHQGRHGKKDYVSLKQHSEVLTGMLGREVQYNPINESVGKAIRNLKDGDILLLENTRFLFEEKMNLTPEEHSKHAWVKLIAENCDLFVQDALSICHRNHASVVGFSPLLPSFIGPTLERELNEIDGQLMEKQEPKIFILSGFKLEEPIAIMEKMLNENRTDFVLCGGMLGKTLLKAKGIEFGAEDAFMKERGFMEFVPRLKTLVEKHGDKIILPQDFAIEVDGKRKDIGLGELPVDSLIYDVGAKTVEEFRKYIAEAKCMTLNGPLGLSEKPMFARGTRQIFEAIGRAEGHSILGGGQTLEAIKALSIDEDKFNLVSLAGGALLEYLGGRKLPGLECLKQ